MATDTREMTTHMNRYGVNIKITRIGLLEFLMEYIDMFFMRTSVTDDDRIIMFDPSGGPYMTAEHGNQPGTDMGYFLDEWKGLIVGDIKWGEKEGSVILSCYSENPVEWVDVKGKLSF